MDCVVGLDGSFGEFEIDVSVRGVEGSLYYTDSLIRDYDDDNQVGREKRDENRFAKMLNMTKPLDNEYRRGEENAAFGSTANNKANLSLDLTMLSREMVSKTEGATGMRYGELGRNISGSSVGRSDVKSFADRG
ncbi:hypothetical protein Droror1_Dr00017357 [Drosera rotundifolia]